MITDFKMYENFNSYETDILLRGLQNFMVDFFNTPGDRNDIKSKIVNSDRYDWYTLSVGKKQNIGGLLIYFNVYISEKDQNLNHSNDFILLSLEEKYVSIKTWSEILKLKEFLMSILSEFGSYNEELGDYVIKSDIVLKLTKKLTMKEYTFRQETNKYNL